MIDVGNEAWVDDSASGPRRSSWERRGALTIAAELSLAGVEVTVADQPRFSASVEAVAAARGVRVTFEDVGEERFASVARTSLDPAAAIKGVALVIVSVPSFGHRPVAELIASELEDGQTILWVGEAKARSRPCRRSGPRDVGRPFGWVTRTHSRMGAPALRGPAG